MNPNKVVRRDPADSGVRKAVIDHRTSFIVQAPAGSGKTELLIQRFLNLLANAEISDPESILAITFTRKAASEMRNRILGALERASNPGAPADSNSALTDVLAVNVLERDRQRGWGILANPARLQVRTVDSFCESVVRQMPILARFSVASQITEDADALYEQAAEQTLRLLTHPTPAVASAIESLLLYLDNNLKRVQQLLVEMLKRRDQWLPLLGRCDQYDAEELARFRDTLRAALSCAVQSELTEIRKVLADSLDGAARSDFLCLASYAAQNLRSSASENRVALLAEVQELPGVDPEAVTLWLAVRDFFLNKGGNLWGKLTAKNGFPPGSVCKPYKERCEELFSSLRGNAKGARLTSALKRLDYLPPVVYTESQWECVRALLVALPLAVAQLKVIFAEQGMCDFVEVAQAARQALSPADASQVALALGYRIQHILVDEFQDTSVAQIELLRRLTSEWAAGDGNTLFLVGDPMQSIYGFRQAEVTLFEDARNGQARLPLLQSRDLSVNFRSSASLVDWFNRVFKDVLTESNHATGAVEYKPADSAQTDADCCSEIDGVHLYGIEKGRRDSEAACVADIVSRVRQQRPNERIAILVRARTHLADIVRALQTAGIAFRAVEIDPLGDRQIVRDLQALTLAITHPADRIAWLAVLRSPACGLPLPDLLELCHDDERSTIPQLLELRRSRLSKDGRNRCDNLLNVFRDALRLRGRIGLRQLIERTWIAIGGPVACDDRERSMADAAAFFDLLQQCEVAGDLADTEAFTQKLEKLFAPVETGRPGVVEIMTIHGAKGLQWDTVILPGLARTARRGGEQLLYWREFVSDGDSHLLLAPVDSPGIPNGGNSIQTYLKRLSDDRTREELKRLLYVACTRARVGLHLVSELPEEEANPNSGSMLSLLWNVADVRSSMRQFQSTALSATKPKFPPSVLRRLPVGWRLPDVPPALDWEGRSDSLSALQLQQHTFDWVSERLRHVGTATHRMLQQIGRDGLENWTAQRVAERKDAIRNILLELGIPEPEAERAVLLVCRALENTLDDPRGRWIVGSHPEAACELELSGILNGSIVRIKIDRTFVDEQGVRWIVDYKTSEVASSDSVGFLDAQVEKFRPDLYRYRTILSLVDARPIRMGLYFPLLKAWREVE